jgi:DNA invertase Pin-like site-specific DNA recombinase
MKLGYARVSTDDQSLSVQLEQLKAAGCITFYQETASGKNAERRMLQTMLREIEEGGPGARPHVVVVVTKLDRLARNTVDALQILERLGKAGAGFVSLGEPWLDTTSPWGKMMTTIVAGFAEFERSLILQRTSEGRTLAMKNGVKFGRPSALSSSQQRIARGMLKDGASVKNVALEFKVCRKTIQKLKRSA